MKEQFAQKNIAFIFSVSAGISAILNIHRNSKDCLKSLNRAVLTFHYEHRHVEVTSQNRNSETVKLELLKSFPRSNYSELERCSNCFFLLGKKCKLKQLETSQFFPTSVAIVADCFPTGNVVAV